MSFFSRAGFDGRPPKAVIYGVSGLELTQEEQRFFAEADPFGFILFKRNCDNPEQIKRLIADLFEAVGRKWLPVLIDQEGGRVARLVPPYWRKAPPAGMLASLDEESAKRAIYANARLIASELTELGITVDCAPVLDLLFDGAHNIIGDRAYGAMPVQVAELARQMAQGLLDGGVLPVIKHIPGHGRALVDSHESLPLVKAQREELEQLDFEPFCKLNDMPLAMTAHILYEALDKERVATLSPEVIRIIREEIGFQGVLMSDDVSMKALKGDVGELTQQIITAGCDLVLHCNGKMEEMQSIHAAVPTMSDVGMVRTEQALSQLKPSQTADVASLQSELDTLLRVVA